MKQHQVQHHDQHHDLVAPQDQVHGQVDQAQIEQQKVQSKMKNDDIIMTTADDAIQSKLSAVIKGYYQDPFVPYFAVSDATGSGGSSGSHGSHDTSATTSSRTRTGSSSRFNTTTSSLLNNDIDFNNLGNNRLLEENRMNRRMMRNIGGVSSSTGGVGGVSGFSGFSGGMGQHQFQQNHHHQRQHHHRHHHQQHQHQQHSPRQQQHQHHQPLIRRGTFARTCTMDYAISTFLSLCHETKQQSTQVKHDNGNNDNSNDNNNDDNEKDIQIVILGSGRDTTYLRSMKKLLNGTPESKIAFENDHNIMNHVKWYEIDHEKVIQMKYELLVSCPLFDFECEQFEHGREYGCEHGCEHEHEEGSKNHESTSLPSSSTTATSSFAIRPKAIHKHPPRTRYADKFKMSSLNHIENQAEEQSQEEAQEEAQYHLVGYDLCNPFEKLLDILKKNHSFKLDQPTLFVMECVQMYIPEQESRNILQSITSSLTQPYITIFDPIIQNDKFGQVMAQNLTKAKIITNPNMSLLQSRTLQCQIHKLISCGFSIATGCDFMTCYECIMSGEDRKHANRIEMLDEIEEFVLIMKHYCFVVATSATSIESEDNMLRLKYCSVGDDSSLGFKHGRCISQGQE